MNALLAQAAEQFSVVASSSCDGQSAISAAMNSHCDGG